MQKMALPKRRILCVEQIALTCAFAVPMGGNFSINLADSLMGDEVLDYHAAISANDVSNLLCTCCDRQRIDFGFFGLVRRVGRGRSSAKLDSVSWSEVGRRLMLD